MKRSVVLGVLLALGGLVAVKAQPPAADAPKVIDVEKVKDNLYVLRGGGGNTAVFVMANGVTVVDAKNPGWGQPILDKVKELTPKPITMLINTHTHGDHVSGNVDFPATVDIVVQENTKTNMEKMPIFKEHNGAGMAKRTFKDKMTIGKGADQIDLFYFGPGHTNGDAWVSFPAIHAAHVGDMFASKAMPNVDGDNGGSMLHYGETLKKGHDAIKGVEVVINGHNATTTTWADLDEYTHFIDEFTAWAKAELKAGKTPEQAAAEWKNPDKYSTYGAGSNTLFGGMVGRLKVLADEMKK
jgi:glyoxylase-like metal-dependent hydrolase (beta-lactamase superfamily II)